VTRTRLLAIALGASISYFGYMCGRFTQAFTWNEVIEFYRLLDEIAPALTPSWNVAPTHPANTIVLEESAFRTRRMQFAFGVAMREERIIAAPNVTSVFIEFLQIYPFAAGGLS